MLMSVFSTNNTYPL